MVAYFFKLLVLVCQLQDRVIKVSELYYKLAKYCYILYIWHLSVSIRLNFSNRGIAWK